MSSAPAPHQPFVPPDQSPPELTWAPVAVGSLLGIVFGASSLYLVLKVGLTVSASIPVAVMAITLFRGFSKAFGLRRATILENNVVQTAGSAGESIAFGVGLTMPALLLLGFDIDVVRVMTVGVLGGLLGILMMIPLRRAFVVKQHGTLAYPEGTACADVLIAGEKGGATARMVFLGFGIGFAYQFLMLVGHLWKEVAAKALYTTTAAGKTVGLKAGVLAAELSAPLLGVGYIIGPRIGGIMVGGGVLAYLALVPAIAYFGEGVDKPVAPAVSKVDEKTGVDKGLIKHMSPKDIRDNYILYIGAGAVAAGGIISMLKAMPVIVGSVAAGFRDLKAERAAARGGTAVAVPRTERDLSMTVVLFGSIGMVMALALAPAVGLGFTPAGFLGAIMILVFGFLFVTVSSRLTGEIGSSSNPISGMTVATLLLTCLLLLILGEAGVIPLGKETKLAALTVAAVVCIASSNGGTTSQALKTGYLVGATPRSQQYAILIGSLTSALVVGVTLLWLNQAGTVYTKKDLPTTRIDVAALTVTDTVRSGQYAAEDSTVYKVLNVGESETGAPAPAGRYLVNADGVIAYRVDPAVNGTLEEQDNGNKVNKFDAPKTRLMSLIINGILDQKLPWELVLIGVLIAVTLELAGVPALPFAVGVYLPLSASTPIFIGGLVRWLVDTLRKAPDEGDTSPGVLLSSGYIAGGSIAALVAAFLEFAPNVLKALNLEHLVEGVSVGGTPWAESNLPVLTAFGLLVAVLVAVGARRPRG
ncbi:OPT family oligopeptide transporter [Urbifossiella limnaea]|uniref:OPT oligopeptide transporter protein n=1 Tax=Urbifossiella limnaea TaxID=2528023 RepID=A0A517Y3L6_9BACT|nr:oligopeptide transporter, OPT family [Urbifossiella limnaea]QDU24318.1 OPT oligopeptide transporter protein [Urbifossiella limnaea]